MRLFEFAENDPLRVKLTAVADQLQVKALDSNRTMSTDEFLRYLTKFGLNIGKSDLFDIATKEPLSNFITTVNKDKVVFKGQEEEPETSISNAPDIGQPQDSAKTIKQMASRALK